MRAEPWRAIRTGHGSAAIRCTPIIKPFGIPARCSVFSCIFFLTGLPVGLGPRSLVGAGSPVGSGPAVGPVSVTEKFLYIKLSVTRDIFSFLRRRHSWLATNLKHPRKYARALNSGTRIVTRQRSRLTRVALHRGAPNVNDYWFMNELIGGLFLAYWFFFSWPGGPPGLYNGRGNTGL